MISIIIPVKKKTKYLKECLENISKLEYADFEVLVMSDAETGDVAPGKKRNMGADRAQGEIFAFIDDDAYPRADWLTSAMKCFEDPGISAVCGPGVTPDSDSFLSQVSGAVYLSYASGANPDRFYPGNKKEVDDWPSMNFLIRKNDFLSVGGFNEKYYPGEDSVLCNNLFKAGKKMIYSPDVLVYHHRRDSLVRHLVQVGNHKRGLFARMYPENSRKIKYFLPSLFLLFVVFGWLLVYISPVLYISLWILYGLTLLVAIIEILLKIKKLGVSLACLIYIPLTHLWYGWGFIRGLLFKK